MQAAPFPPDEQERLKDLYAYRILDTDIEEDFEAIVDTATMVCEAPMAFVNLLDRSRHWFKASVGMPWREGPREFAFCSYTILQPDEILVIEDTLKDERFRDNPLVTSDPSVRFYAGVPLVSEEGHPLGTVSVLDRVPRHLEPWQLEVLRGLGRQTEAQLELRRKVAELHEAVAERDEARVALRKQRDRLVRTNRDLEAFTYLVSHDLKEPVRGLQVYLKAAMEDYGDTLPAPLTDLLERAEDSADRLSLLLEGLLALSRVNRLEPSDLQPTDVAATVTSPECRVRYGGAVKERDASVEVSTEGCGKVLATRPALAQILGNLILNGIRHNASSRPVVRVRTSPDPEHEGRIVVCVEDDGRGFSPDAVSRFNAGELVGNTNHDGGSGGFGLSIARQTVQRLGGSMRLAESGTLGGACVCLRLPAA